LRGSIQRLDIHHQGRTDRFSDPVAVDVDGDAIFVRPQDERWQAIESAETIIIEEFSASRTAWLGLGVLGAGAVGAIAWGGHQLLTVLLTTRSRE
jgi:hypothetical protein